MSQMNTTSTLVGSYVSANGLDIYYEECGSGPPLLLLHGGTRTHKDWEPTLPAFAPHFRVITPDSRGHGRTNNPSGPIYYRQMAEDVAAFIEALNLTRPAVFGYSDGGQIALELAIRYPGLASALVIAAAWYDLSEPIMQFNQSLGLRGPGDVDLAHVQEHLQEWIEEWQRDHASGGEPDYWRTLVTNLSYAFCTPPNYSKADFQQVTDPTLILIGDRDGIIPVEQAVDMYHFIPGAELAVLPNATHGTALNDQSIALVLDFLLRHAEATAASSTV